MAETPQPLRSVRKGDRDRGGSRRHLGTPLTLRPMALIATRNEGDFPVRLPHGRFPGPSLLHSFDCCLCSYLSPTISPCSYCLFTPWLGVRPILSSSRCHALSA